MADAASSHPTRFSMPSVLRPAQLTYDADTIEVQVITATKFRTSTQLFLFCPIDVDAEQLEHRNRADKAIDAVNAAAFHCLRRRSSDGHAISEMSRAASTANFGIVYEWQKPPMYRAVLLARKEELRSSGIGTCGEHLTEWNILIAVLNHMVHRSSWKNLEAAASVPSQDTNSTIKQLKKSLKERRKKHASFNGATQFSKLTSERQDSLGLGRRRSGSFFRLGGSFWNNRKTGGSAAAAIECGDDLPRNDGREQPLTFEQEFKEVSRVTADASGAVRKMIADGWMDPASLSSPVSRTSRSRFGHAPLRCAPVALSSQSNILFADMPSGLSDIRDRLMSFERLKVAGLSLIAKCTPGSRLPVANGGDSRIGEALEHLCKAVDDCDTAASLLKAVKVLMLDVGNGDAIQTDRVARSAAHLTKLYLRRTLSCFTDSSLAVYDSSKISTTEILGSNAKFLPPLKYCLSEEFKKSVYSVPNQLVESELTEGETVSDEVSSDRSWQNQSIHARDMIEFCRSLSALQGGRKL